MTKYLCFICLLLILYACSQDSNNISKVDSLQQNNTDSIYNNSLNKGNVMEDKPNFSDSISLPFHYSICSNEHLPNGTIYFNQQFYAIMDQLSGDCIIPYIKTYQLNGTPIDSFAATTGECYNDCGYYCNETFSMEADLRFTSIDTITYYKCDSLGEDRTQKTMSIFFIEGHIDPTGKIISKDPIKKKL